MRIPINKSDQIGKLPINKPVQSKGYYHPLIEAASYKYEVDIALIKAIIMAESRYNSKAVSKKGAIGLMQLMPETADDLGVENSFNPEHNIQGGVKHLKKLLKQFNGNVTLAVAAYNAGSTTVRRYKGIPPYRATQKYVAKVHEYYQNYKEETKEEKML